MNELLNRVSSYNIFNYLLPGTVFAMLVGPFAGFPFMQSDVVIALFSYYFIGLVISRFGSLVLEPLLRRTSFVKFADYEDFVTASRRDPKIEVLSEVNNTYRTLFSLFVLLLLLKGVELVELRLPGVRTWNLPVLGILMVVMFLFSYRKQTEYVSKRVQAARASE